MMKLYGKLAAWWPLMSPPDEYEGEGAAVLRLLRAAGAEPGGRLLELGCGGGHLASHLKASFTVTLVDMAPPMLAVSEALNPECRHLVGDMRSLRLGETFDAVLIHDAICHMTTADDLRAALATASAHCRPGGAAIFCPDEVAEGFMPRTTTGGIDRDGRGMRFVEWTHRPNGHPGYVADYAYLLREADGAVSAEHDHGEFGLFSETQWRAWISAAGFTLVEASDPAIVHGFLARRV